LEGERLYVLQTIERGRAEVVQGSTISYEQVRRELQAKWLKNGVK